MNKRKIDQLLPEAYEILNTEKIAKDGVIDKTYRSYISAFGAAIEMGSLLAAISYFSKGNEKANQPQRPKLLKAIKALLYADEQGDFFNIVKKKISENGNISANERKVKEDIINAAIALKLAMNLYELKQK